MFRFLAVSLASGLAMTAVAHAQAAEDDGLDCVYNELVDSYELVAEAFLYGDLSAEELAKSQQAVDAAMASCDAKHSYGVDQAEVAADLGKMGSAIDYLSEELLFGDVSEAAINAVLDAYDAFTDEELDAIFDPDWRSDAVFYARVKAKMTTAGIPDESWAIDTALTIVEIAALMEEATYLFMLDEDAQ
jgi:hypothetical protein